MKRASITEAKNNLSALIDGLRGGQSVLILDRGRPVARLEPVDERGASDESRVARLVREGVLRPGRGKIPAYIFEEMPPRLPDGFSALNALLEERRSGR